MTEVLVYCFISLFCYCLAMEQLSDLGIPPTTSLLISSLLAFTKPIFIPFFAIYFIYSIIFNYKSSDTKKRKRRSMTNKTHKEMPKMPSQ